MICEMCATEMVFWFEDEALCSISDGDVPIAIAVYICNSCGWQLRIEEYQEERP